MSPKYDKRAMGSLQKKLAALKSLVEGDVTSKIAEAISTDLHERASQAYASAKTISPITVSSVQLGDGKSRVVASGKEVAYIEFGTGEYARGTYPGTLPTHGVPITGSWEYYYKSPHKRVAKSGDFGWYYGGHFVTGQAAGAEMWLSAEETRKIASRLAKKIIEEELRGGSR